MYIMTRRMINFQKNIIGLSTVMINKKILNRIKFPNLRTQGFCCMVKSFKKANKVIHIPMVLSS